MKVDSEKSGETTRNAPGDIFDTGRRGKAREWGGGVEMRRALDVLGYE